MSIKVIVDGKNINFPDQKPRIISGTTLIPISLVLKEMGYTITDWRLNNLGNLQIAPTGTMIAEKGSNKIIIDEAKQIFISNGLRFSYESLSYACVVGGRVMLPLRKVLESLGCEVDWEKVGDDDIITVTTNPQEYTVNFDPNGGEISSQNESLTVLSYTPLALPVPTRKGCVFEGWYTEKEDGTRIGGVNDEFTVRANLTLYARWISIVGYFKIRNAEGKYLTYVGKSNDPITVEAANDAATQIWKIELSSEDDKYHIRPVKFSTLAMNVYRSGDYPCTIQPTAGNIEDTSFSIGRVQDLNCTVNWGGTHYLTESSDKAYWTETDTPQEWTLEPTSYTPPPVEYYHIQVLAKATGMPIKNATVCMVPVKTDTEDADLEFFTTDEDGRVDIAAMGEQENVNYKSVGFVVHADGYADWSSEECTLAPSSNLTVELKAKSEYPDYSLPLNNISGPIRANHRDFGWRYLESIDYHTGIDLGNNYTSDKIVKSICDGTVVEHDFKSQAGNYVMVKDDKGYYITYMHLASHTDFEVDAANRIVKGARIGIMSNTVINGDPTKDQGGMKVHLHISIGTKQTIQKSARTYLDPKAFLPF